MQKSVTFNLTVTDIGYGTINFTIVKPDGCYVSGQRKTLGEVHEALYRAIGEHNRHNEQFQFEFDNTKPTK